jgi:hypothetical protein
MKRALFLVLLAACGSKKSSDPAPTPAPEKVATGSSAAPAPAPTTKPAPPVAKAGSGSGSGSDAPVSAAQIKAYQTAMSDGRKATDKKDYAAAIAAFDKALVAKRADSRALAERGFARLLDGKDLVAASADLDAAASGTKDIKLQGMIWFNRGLVEEARKDQPNAIAAFSIANSLNPSAAAKAKIAGKSTCQAMIVNPFAVEGTKITDAKDWPSLLKAIVPAEEAAAMPDQMALEQPASLPAVFMLHFEMEDFDYLAVKTATGMRAYPLGGAMMSKCQGHVEFDVASSDAKRVVVHGTELLQVSYSYMCQKDDKEVDCNTPGADWAHKICDEVGGVTMRDVVVDLAAGTMIAVEQPDGKAFAAVKVDAAGVHLSGNGCDGAR